MRIALISDIHANLPALESVLEDIDGQTVDAIYCLGDLVGYNIWPNEVINLIRARTIATLAGNHDLKVVPGKPSGLNDVKTFAYDLVGEAERQYLLTLPAHIRLEFRVEQELINVLFVHGSPRGVDEYLLEDMDEAHLLTIMKDARADVLCFGHSHKPYHRILKTGGQEVHAINIGSVGKPKDGDPRGCYVILDFEMKSKSDFLRDLSVCFRRVSYDIVKAMAAIHDSILHDELAERLAKAY